MQTTNNPTSEIVAQAKSQAERMNTRLLHLLSFVPDDKLTWTPSTTSRSSLRIVAHCALSNMFFANVITGNLPASMPPPEKFFKELDEEAKKITTRESAIALAKEAAGELCKAIETVSAENIHSTPISPFGPLAMQFWMSQGYNHMVGHAGQMEYLQTLWGDLDNHFN